MIMLVEKQQAEDQNQGKFWIDPEMEVALTAQINEHLPGHEVMAEPAGAVSTATPELMNRYNQPQKRLEAQDDDA